MTHLFINIPQYISYGNHLSGHFTYTDTPGSQGVRRTEFLLYLARIKVTGKYTSPKVNWQGSITFIPWLLPWQLWCKRYSLRG